jgi:hypothetical protein
VHETKQQQEPADTLMLSRIVVRQQYRTPPEEENIYMAGMHERSSIYICDVM